MWGSAIAIDQIESRVSQRPTTRVNNNVGVIVSLYFGNTVVWPTRESSRRKIADWAQGLEEHSRRIYTTPTIVYLRQTPLTAILFKSRSRSATCLIKEKKRDIQGWPGCVRGRKDMAIAIFLGKKSQMARAPACRFQLALQVWRVRLYMGVFKRQRMINKRPSF